MIGMAVSRVGDWFGSTPTAPEVSLHAALDVLRNPRRRMLVRYLADISVSHGERAQKRVKDMAEVLAARETGCERSEVPSNRVKSMYVSLIDTHLPRLDDVGVVEYDEDRKTVEREPTVEAFAAFLEDGAERFEAEEVADER